MRARRSGLLWFVVGVVGVGVGCGDGGGGAGSAGGQSGCADCGPYGDVLDAFCGVMDRCPGAVYPVAYRNRGECVAILAWASTCRLEDDEVNDVHHYRLKRTIPTVSPAAAGACAAWLKAATCEQAAGLGKDEDSSGASAPDAGPGSPCQGIFQVPDDDSGSSQPATPPPAAAGERCRNGDQKSCRAGLYCAGPVFSSATNSETCATCTPLPGLGQPCGDNYYCAQGLYCRTPLATDPPGTQRLCQEPQADGSSCFGDGECRSGFCRRSGGSYGTCDPGGKAGQPCMVARDCRYPLMCNPASQCESPRDYGAPCAADDQCAARRCDPISKLCGLPEGTPCRSHGDCRTGYCHDSTRLCAVRKAVGETCVNYSECASNYCRSGICAERCGSDRPCPVGQFCYYGTQQCRPLGADGAGCQGDEECLSGWCNSADRCATKPHIGDACARSSDCYPQGYCSGGKCIERLDPGASCQALDSCKEPFLCRKGRCELVNLSCAPAPAGSMCAYLRICQDGAYCDVQDSFTCKPSKAGGEACLLTTDCNADLFCQSDPQTGNRRCVPRLAAGGGCQADECAPGLYCIGERTARTCQAGPAGQPCSTQTPCPTGYHCNSDDVCQPPLPLGQRCSTASVPCAEGLYCDTIMGCRPKRQQGEACSSRETCVESLRCLGSPGACQPRAKVGETCQSTSSASEDSGCEPGLFCEYDSMLKMTLCQAPRPLGATCNGDTRCASGACGQSLRCVAMNVCKMP